MSVYKTPLTSLKPPCSRHCQEGVALLTALLIAALVTVAAVAMASRQQLDVRRTGNMLEADQAYMYALAAEALAVQVLNVDRGLNQVDTLDDIWNEELPPTIIEGGMISGSIKDLQGRFNLNNLVDVVPGNNKGKPEPEQTRIFQRILAQVSLAEKDVQLSPFMANRVTDWIDDDLNSLADGAEDLNYLNLDLPYRAANRLMTNPSELAAVAGFSLADVAALKRYVIALPQRNTATSATQVNVNTAEAMVLMSLDQNITAQIAEDLITFRTATPFEKTANFVDELAHLQITLDPKVVSSLSVTSDYFLITSNASIGRTALDMYSLVERTATGVVVVSRSIGTNEFNQ